MNKDLILQHIEFIEKDTEQRGEEIIGDIVFIAALYQCEVKKDGGEKQIVMYSAAEMVMDGYRAINI